MAFVSANEGGVAFASVISSEGGVASVSVSPRAGGVACPQPDLWLSVTIKGVWLKVRPVSHNSGGVASLQMLRHMFIDHSSKKGASN